MSYHWNRQGDIWAWKKDVWFLTRAWGIEPRRVNLGVGYFSKHGPTWSSLARRCPNVPYAANVCDGVVFVGKKMNYDIGVLASGLGGVFPWELSYDAYGGNDTLAAYLVRGATGRGA